jgi:hypothetical protein
MHLADPRSKANFQNERDRALPSESGLSLNAACDYGYDASWLRREKRKACRFETSLDGPWSERDKAVQEWANDQIMSTNS